MLMRLGSDFFKKIIYRICLLIKKMCVFCRLKGLFKTGNSKYFFAFMKKNTTFAFPNGGCHSSVGRAKD